MAGKRNLLSLLLVGILFFVILSPVSAAPIEELKNQIEERNKQIEELEKEIEEYRAAAAEKTEEAGNLQSEIARLNSAIGKLKADIRLTENKIELANLNIEKLQFEIQAKEQSIILKKGALAESLRILREADSQTLVEIMLAYANFSDFFGTLDRMEEVQNSLNLTLDDLKILKEELLNQETEETAFKQDMEALNTRLADQKEINETSKSRKDSLLKETKKQEQKYKNLLADRLAKQEALEEEIRAIEEQIRVEIDPSSLPASRKGVLAWPLDKLIITQDFGNTPFATQNPQIYNGKGHNGTDFRAAVGDLVRSSESGKVTAVGDTDKQCRGVSYGKWILIEHQNNLSTLYAHLSLIKVSPGQAVSRGEVIGYSGDTGYVTGPHLHFTVFASKAVQVSQLKSKICGTYMTLPLAPYNAYLNPLSYL